MVRAAAAAVVDEAAKQVSTDVGSARLLPSLWLPAWGNDAP
jgi:hypothetical protein